ncbi:MAG: class I mannose-6-phosphate isomerase [Novosphingobium sp.]
MSVLLATTLSERPWGVDRLPSPFHSPAGERIGEVWFTPTPPLDALLVKYLFTTEKLSVQVHPSDADAPKGSRGKEECWLILDAEPEAKIAIGFKAPIGPEAMRAAALDGSLEDLLAWYPARPGDFFYIPAGTVHAIGPGLTLIETQQNSDVTYRLYDYGRGRELHLDAGIAVADGSPYDPANRRHVPRSGEVALVKGPHFRLDRLDGPPSAATTLRYDGPLLVLPLDTPLEVCGETVGPGQCALAPSLAKVEFAGRSLIAQPL